jgi:hypothetical protein
VETGWEDAEPSLGVGFGESRRVLRRGWKRPFWALLVPLLAALGSAVVTLGREQAHVATVVLSLPPKGAFGRDVTLFLRRSMSVGQASRTELSDTVLYIKSAIFSDDNLLALMGRDPAFDELLRKGPRKALDSVRSSITVSQYAGHYIGEHTEDVEDLLGSQVKLECASGSYSKTTLKLCLQLSSLILTADAEQRIGAVDRKLGADEFLLEKARKQTETAQQEIVEKTAQLADMRSGVPLDEIPPRTEDEARLYVEITRLTSDLQAKLQALTGMTLRQRVKSTEPLLYSVYEAAGAPSKSWSLLLVDAGRPGPPELGDVLVSCFVAALIPFLLILPFSMLMVGTWDRRVYDLDDIRDLGLGTLGVVDLGLWRSRLAWRRDHG